MLLEFEGAYYEPLSLAMVRTYLALKTGKFPEVEPGFAPERYVSRSYGGLEWLKDGPLTIPVDETASALIPYRWHKFSFPYLSLSDVIKDRIVPDALRGKIALIGTTAPGLQDLRSTPVDSVFPGVEIHANLIAGMLDRDLKQKPPYMLGAEVVVLVISGAVLAVLIPMLSALWATVAAGVGFILISEALKPDELREYINEYLTDMSTIIRSKYRGTLDKYIGDEIMAFWGAPVDDAQHARNGVHAAIEMQRERERLNAKFAARGWPTLKIGVGVNSGTVRVGDMGSQVRRAYTAMGDAVNVASRLEGRTKGYGVGILVGEATRNAVGDVVFREVDRIKVKGKDEAVTVYEPIGLESEVGKDAHDELRLWNQALRHYREQQWDQVEVCLLNLQRMNPACELYQVYAGKVAEKRRQPPPPDWDGVTAFDEK